jgi:hypothetical protein|tara:strand:- start:271 stop:597 length:327 start_codon:yes stop_codon:yes gene_type:complete
MPTVKESDEQKKWLRCLRCNKQMWTDRCHRICVKCQRRNNAQHVKDVVAIAEPGKPSTASYTTETKSSLYFQNPFYSPKEAESMADRVKGSFVMSFFYRSNRRQKLYR